MFVLQQPLAFMRTLLQPVLQDADCVVDATMGNGYDTLWLSQHIGHGGHVYAFDVQMTALEQTHRRLRQHGHAANVCLIHAGHEHMLDYVKQAVDVCVFNLGYLPQHDQHITTTAATTLTALEQGMALLKPLGLIAVMVYRGHPQGAIEHSALQTWLQALPQQQWQVVQYAFINQRNLPPYLLLIQKQAHSVL